MWPARPGHKTKNVSTHVHNHVITHAPAAHDHVHPQNPHGMPIRGAIGIAVGLHLSPVTALGARHGAARTEISERAPPAPHGQHQRHATHKTSHKTRMNWQRKSTSNPLILYLRDSPDGRAKHETTQASQRCRALLIGVQQSLRR